MADRSFTIRDIADLVGARVRGDQDRRIESVASLDQAGPTDLTFASSDKFVSRLSASRAGAAIVAREVEDAAMPLLLVDNVEAAVAEVLGAFACPEDLPPVGVDATARIAPGTTVADDAHVGPGVVIGAGAKIAAKVVLCANVAVGDGVSIGEGSVLQESAVVRNGCVLGRRVRIGPNSVIGADGFGYYTDKGAHHKIPHIGNVVIEDDVEIGACSCVDRAKFGSTLVGAGTKIDNLVQVAHNVQIGRGCFLCGHVGVAGSVKLGDYVAAGGHAGFRDNVEVGDRVQCSAFAAVASDVPDGQRVVGIPARPATTFFRELKALEQLPGLLKRVRALERKQDAGEPSKDD